MCTSDQSWTSLHLGLWIFGPRTSDHDYAKTSALPMPLFGLNDFDTDSEVADIQAGSSHFAAVTKNGDLYMWRRNKHGLLGIGTDKDQFFPLKVCMAGSVDRVSCGTEHTVVLTKTCIMGINIMKT